MTADSNDYKEDHKNEVLEVGDVSTEVQIEVGKSCVKENETAQNFVKMKTAEQEKKSYREW